MTEKDGDQAEEFVFEQLADQLSVDLLVEPVYLISGLLLLEVRYFEEIMTFFDICFFFRSRQTGTRNQDG